VDQAYFIVSKPAAQRFVLPLKSAEFVQQIEHDLYAREVNSQDLPKPVNHSQPRDFCHVKEQNLVFLPNGRYESELHKSLGQQGMDAGTRRQYIER
jgi:hypothetical protein